MSTLFISHSSRDNAESKKLEAWLDERGYGSVFLDLDPEKGIQAGASWERTLYTKLRACRAVVALCSSNCLGSQWCFAEIALTRMEGKEILALQIDPWDEDTKLPSILTERQFIDLRTEPEKGFERLELGLKALGIVPEEHRDWTPGKSPFPGLRAFDEKDAPIFFGRDAEILEGVELMTSVRRQGHPRLVMILGSSGSGKSSLARAGILPRLRADRDSWLIVGPLRPGGRPALELAASFAKAFEELGKPRSRAEILARLGEPAAPAPGSGEQPTSGGDDREESSAREMLRLALLRMKGELTAEDSQVATSLERLEEYLESRSEEPAPARAGRTGALDSNPLAALADELRLDSGFSEAKVVIVIDQFEELLGHEDEGADHPANHFLRLLKEGIEADDNPPLALGTMRSDFLGMLQRSGPLRGVGFKSLSVGPMSDEGMLKVIEAPATLAGIDLERPELTQRLLKETGTPDALPLLAFTLRAMWDRYHESLRFDVQGYEALGGLQGAIAQVADDTMEAALAKSEGGTKKDLRVAFLSLARPAAEGTGWARQPASWDEMPEQVQPMIQQFIDQRLLVKRADGTVEVAHEALFRSWKTLRRWLDANAEGLHLLREIRVDAEKWEKAESQTEKEPYLWRSGRLARALELRGRGVLRLTELDTSFIEASDSQEKRLLAKEEARRQRELRRVRLFLAVVSVVALIAAGLGGLAFVKQREAKRREAEARASALLTAAEANPDPLLRVLLLGQMTDSPEPPRGLDVAWRATQSAPPPFVLRGHDDMVFSVAFSPSGDRIVTGSYDTTARIWKTNGSDRDHPIVLGGSGGHEDKVWSAVFSPSGDRIVTTSADRTARIWKADGSDRDHPIVLDRHGDGVGRVAFSPSGDRIVTVSWDRTARIWKADGSDREDPIVLEGHQDKIRRVAFSPSGEHVVTGSDDNTARIWRADGSDRGDPIVLDGHQDKIWSVAFSPSGDHVVTGSDDGEARIWKTDGSDRDDPILLKGHGGTVRSVAFSPSGDRIVTGSYDRTARIWKTDGSDRDHPILLKGHGDVVWSVAFSPSGESILTGANDSTARIWKADGSDREDPIVLAGHDDTVFSAAFSPSGKQIVTGSWDNTARVWAADGSDRDERLALEGHRLTLKGHEDQVWSVAFSPSGDRIVTGSYDTTARIWKTNGSDRDHPIVLGGSGGHEDKVWSAVFSPSGDRIVTTSADRTARIWKADGSDRDHPIVLDRHGDGVGRVAFSPSGDRIVTVSWDRTARIWKADGSDREDPIVLEGHQDKIRRVAFSPSGEHVVTGSDDNTARIWRADGSDRGDPIVLEGHQDKIWSVAFSPSGDRVVTGSNDHTARIWRADGSDLDHPIVLEGHNREVWRAAFSPSGDLIVTTSEDKTARIWKANGSDRKQPIVLKGHKDPIRSVAFSPSGDHVVTGSDDGTARIWKTDGSDGRDPAVLKGHDTSVWSVAFSPSGEHVVTGSADRTARVWLASWPAALAFLRDATTECLTATQRTRYLGQSRSEALSGYQACERSHGRSSPEASARD